MTTLEERRKNKRFHEKLQIFMEEPESVKPHSTKNVSENGVFINCPKKFRSGSKIQFQILCRDLSGPLPIRVIGKVVFSKGSVSEGSMVEPGFGVSFIDFPTEEDKSRFSKLVQHLEHQNKTRFSFT